MSSFKKVFLFCYNDCELQKTQELILDLMLNLYRLTEPKGYKARK